LVAPILTETDNSQPQCRAQGSEFRQEQRPRPDRQRRQHQDIAPVRKRRIPAQHRKHSYHQHGRLDQKMFHAPQSEQQDPRWHALSAEHQSTECQGEAEEDQHAGDLAQQPADIALR